MPSPRVSLPSIRSAVIAKDDGTLGISDHQRLPELGPTSILVKTEAVAINPVDTKMLGDFQTPGAVSGLDYAGTFVGLGETLKTKLMIGSRISGMALGMNHYDLDQGAFATYVMVDDDVHLRLPSRMSTEAGASLCTGLSTVALAFRSLELPTPDSPATKPFHVLVYGGSTATGTLAVQLLRQANLIPITTCSPKNFSLVKSRGAEAVFDYHSPTCGEEIRKYTKNNLAFAIDCITSVQSTSTCYAAIGRAGGKYVSLEPYPEDVATRKVVKPDWILALDVLGQDIGWPEPYLRKADLEKKGFAKKWFEMCQRLLDEGKLQHHPLKALETKGLEGVLEGMEIVRKGEVRGEKVVVKIE